MAFLIFVGLEFLQCTFDDGTVCGYEHKLVAGYDLSIKTHSYNESGR